MPKKSRPWCGEAHVGDKPWSLIIEFCDIPLLSQHIFLVDFLVRFKDASRDGRWSLGLLDVGSNKGMATTFHFWFPLLLPSV